MYMTRASGLPEPRHKSQLCFSESHLWFLVKKKKITEALMFETDAKSSILGRKKKLHLVPEWHIGYGFTFTFGQLASCGASGA